MNRFTLKFYNQQLEQEYQEIKLNQNRKPIFFCLLALCFIMILSATLYEIVTNEATSNKSYQYYSYLIFMVTQFVIVKQKPNLTKYLLLLSNLSTSLLQLNFDSQTQGQIYYTQGSSIMQLQAVAYFVSDFLEGVIQVITLLVIRLVITTLDIQKVDIPTYLIGLSATSFIIVTLYINDRNSRKEFLSTRQEDVWDHSLNLIIQKPHFRFEYNQDIMKIDLISVNQLNQFPGYDPDLCDGCNGRKFMNEYKFIGINLSDLLIQKQQVIQDTIEVSYKNIDFNLRIASVGITKINSIIILENYEKIKSYIIPQKVRIMFKKYSKNFQATIAQKIFNLGLLSVIHINNYEIQEIEIIAIISKIIRMFNVQRIKLYNKQIEYKINTYSYQLRIYLLHIFLLLKQINQKQLSILFQETEDQLILQICMYSIDSNKDKNKFLNLYQENPFINQIQKLILINNMNQDLQIQLKKMIPFLNNC